jgi:hypothetical protein
MARTALTTGDLAWDAVKDIHAKYHDVVAADVANGIALTTVCTERTILNIINTEAEVKATLSTDLVGDNNDLKFTSKLKGHFGNTIKVAYVDPDAANAKLAVTVSGTTIAVSLATDANKAITSTASDVKAAIEAVPAAAALVTVANVAANTGAGVVTAMAATALANGAGENQIIIRKGVYARAGLGDLAVAVPAQSDIYVGPFESMRFEQANEQLYIDPYAVGVTMTIRPVLLPRGV